MVECWQWVFVNDANSPLNKNILNFLNTITDTRTVNKLLVTSFLKHKNISIIINKKINDLNISQSNQESHLQIPTNNPQFKLNQI